MLPNVRKLCSLKTNSNKLMSCLTLSTMCLLITASIVIITIISITPIIILSLGEIKAGQRDLILQPKAHYINSTEIHRLSNQTVLPRLSTQLRLGVKSSQKGKGTTYIAGTAWFMDLNAEREAHLGTIGGGEPLQHRYIYLHSAFQAETKTNVTVQLNSVRSLIKAIQYHVSSLNLTDGQGICEELNRLELMNLTGQFTVKQVFSDAMGKFPIGEVSRYAYLDIHSAFHILVNDTYAANGISLQNSHLVKYLNSRMSEQNSNNEKDVNDSSAQNNENDEERDISRRTVFSLGEFSTQVTINVQNRVELYSDSDYERTYDVLSSFAARVTTQIGLFSVKSSMPIASNLIVMGYFGMFIGVVLKLVILSLFVLSAIMMNNMLSMGVETKQFDMALFKTMGAPRTFLAFYVLLDSLKFVMLSNLVAFPFAYLMLHSTSALFEDFFGYKYDVYPTAGSLLGGVVIGILVPVVAAIAPMWQVLNNCLVEHLNPVRNKTQAIHTEIYVEGQEFPLGQLALGILSTIFGLMIYYLLPKGLIDQDITLLLFVFFTILQGLLVGLVLVGFSFQYLLEHLVARLFLFWANATDFALMLKNLSAHRFKNRRSSILYAFSVAFVVFVSVAIDIQVQTIYNELLKKHGSFLEIEGQGLDRAFYDKLLAKTQGVEDWAYRTVKLSTYASSHHGVKKILISDKAKLYFADNYIYGVSPNLLQTWYAPEISLDRTLSKSPYDPYSYLYTLDGHNSSTLSNYIARKFNILNGENREYLISYYWTDKVARVPMNYSTVLSKRAGLKYNAFNKFSNVGVSMDKYRELAGVPYYQDIPLQYVKVKLANPHKSREVAGKLEKQMSSRNMDKLWEYSELRATIEKIQGLLDTVLDILLLVVLVISFFSLVSTSYVNVIGQSVEIGVLLTLGYGKDRIARIYIYEAFVLVVNSCMIGVAVGSFVAWMMSLQQELFSDFPLTLSIPGLPIIFACAVVSSLLSTYVPLKRLFSKSISQVLNFS